MKALGRFMRVLLLTLFLVSLPPLLLLAAMSSESGSGWLLQQTVRVAQAVDLDLRLQHEAGSLLDRMQLKSVHFEGFGVGFSAEQVMLQWSPGALLGRTLHVRSLRLQEVSLVLPPSTDADTAPPEIPTISLPFVVRIDQFDVLRLGIVQGDVEQRFAALSLAASLDSRRIEARSLQLQMEGLQLSGNLGMGVTGPHPVDGHLGIELEPVLTGDDVGPVSVVVELSGEALRPQIDLQMSRPQPLRVQGRLQLDRGEPGFDLLAESPELGWPPIGEAGVRARDVRIVIQGTANDHQLELSTQLDGTDIPSSSLNVEASGDLNGVQIRRLTLDTLGGELVTRGSLTWQHTPRLDLLIEARALDPGHYLVDWPGSIDGRLQLRGELVADSVGGFMLQAAVEELSGHLRDQPFRASGSLSLANDRVHAEQVQIESGVNRVFVNGDITDKLELDFSVDAPDLRAAYPGLAGMLKGQGRITGRRDAPTVVGSLHGQDLEYPGARVKAVRLDIDWRAKEGSASLRAQGLETADQSIAELSAEVSGSLAKHRVSASATADTVAVLLAATGGLQGDAWLGELSQLDLRENKLGEWRLDRSARLELAKQQVRAGRLCLVQAATRFCAVGGWEETVGLDVEARLGRLDLVRLASLLPGAAELTGRMDGVLEAKGSLQNPELRFELGADDGLVRIEQDLEPLEIRFRDARLDGAFKDDRGRMELRFDLDEKGRAQGTLSLGPEIEGDRVLAGQVQADFPDLGLVAGFVPMLEQVSGRLHLETDLAGTLANPRVSGSLQILDASAQLPAAGVRFSDIGLELDAVGDAPIRVRGGIRSGDGQLTLEGEIDPWSSGGAQVDLRVVGQGFQVAKLPEVLVEISPDLRLQGVGPYHLGGTLEVPRSRIMVRELPRGTVDVSDDEIVVGEEEDESGGAAPRNLTAQVRVELGDEVSFSGFGLETALTGAVDATIGAGGTRLDGKIELQDAEYKAYGQELKVEQGRLIFAGVPSNPEVGLRAARESHDGRVKAFLAVSGPLSKTRSRVYSEPALPDAEALAYLLTGRGLDEAGRGEGNDIAAAALALGMSKGDPLLQDLGDRFGLDELSLEGGGGGIEDSSLLLGKYLNPDLYLGYSQSLFNPEGVVLLRLRLGERLELESRSGNEQSVDLFYRLEHD